MWKAPDMYKFKTAEIANEFKSVFDKCREAYKASPAKKDEPDRGNVVAVKKELFKADSSSDDDVIFVKEEKPTKEEIAEARKWKLPDCFYLYKYKPPCPGCIGCTDGEYDPQKRDAPFSASKESPKPVQSPVVSSGLFKVASPASLQPKSAEPKLDQPIFGSAAATSPNRPSYASVAANLPDFSKLTPDSKSEESNGPSSTASSSTAGSSDFVFGSKATVDFSSLASSGSGGEFAWKKTESSGPFAFAGAGQKLFGRSAGTEQEAGGDDGVVAPSEDIHFEPVIPLPDLVQVKTGEEDWKALFSQRSKLYKFDKKLQQWKERGVGEIKILQHNTQNMFRVIQRREQVLKVACNHLISPDMKLNPMSTSETAWCWTATDFTEAEASVEQFAIKFKNKELAHEFKDVFEKCQETLRACGGQSQDPSDNLGSKPLAANEKIASSTFKVLEKKNIPRVYNENTALEIGANKQHACESSPRFKAMTISSYSQQGDKGNPYHSQALDIAGADTMTAASYSQQGDKENPYTTKTLDIAGANTMMAASYSQQGDKGNPYMTKTLDTMTAASYSQQGDKGNPYHSQALDIAGADTMTAASYSQQGHKGNPYHSQALDIAGADTMTAANYSQQGDKGNPCHSQALDIACVDTMTAASYSQQGDKGNPYHSVEGAPNAQVQAKVNPQEEEEDEEDVEDYDDEDDDEDEEDDDEEEILFEKRATLNRFENGAWKTLGMGTLSVIYNDDLTGNCIRFKSDSGDDLCNHIITRELNVKCDAKTRSCEWKPIDYATDEPIRRHFLASFSSPAATTEFKELFDEGLRLAADNELSENLPSEIDVPEVFSTG
ncbi:E3 SUMO-protein ligase RanBP2 [Elysia marginata]|uniref:E3 SUMO-protein ligase RanBP2 n=1 Tax=Elysia marginata TaxID=1093978 RepID=A0AAV4IY20_9GAST|nr:E3 SUMO-protein ligase RanBP2 [Elysia marginata]